jgi:hypothetical protein
MTVLICGVPLVICACLASVLFRWLAKRRLHAGGAGSPDLPEACAKAPFLGLLWLVVALLIHVLVSNVIAHQDCGLSGDPYVTLPNGYVVGSLNSDDGYIRAPDAKTDRPVIGPGYVRSVDVVNYTDGVFRGQLYDFDSRGFRGFILDSRNGFVGLIDPSSPAPRYAIPANTRLIAASYRVLYAQYRHRWPNYVLVGLILTGEGLIGLWIFRLAQERA